jgi:type VI secretion system secreted protein VgrG
MEIKIMKKLIVVFMASMMLVSCRGAQTSRYEIRKTLTSFTAASGIEMNSEDAISLLFETACVESNLTHRKQLNDGPARGLWQMEPDTYRDIQVNFVAYRPELKKALDHMFGTSRKFSHIERNDEYAIVMARLHYWRVKGAIPKTLKGRAAYWKKHYNTALGKGTVDKYLKAVK